MARCGRDDERTTFPAREFEIQLQPVIPGRQVVRQCQVAQHVPAAVTLPRATLREAPRPHLTRAFAAVLQELSDRYLNPASVAARGWFDVEEIQRIRHHLRNPHYHTEAAMRLWTPIVTEIWARIYIDQRGQRPPA